MTIRELIKERQEEVRSQDLQPGRAADILNELSSLIGTINDRIRECDVAYNHVLLDALKGAKQASHAKIEAECTPEYLLKREARDTKEVTIEMIRSLKYFLKAKEDEYNVSKYQ